MVMCTAVHPGRATRENPVLKPNPSQKPRIEFMEQKQSFRERKCEELTLEAILELGFIKSSLEIVLGVEIIIPEQIILIIMSMTTPITVFFSLSME
ncbi:unnamed protein product [Linum trigynum]